MRPGGMGATADSATDIGAGDSKGMCGKWQVLLFSFYAAALAPRPCPPRFQGAKIRAAVDRCGR